jgi:hypothetical protein
MEGGPGDALMKRLRLIRPELGAASGRTAIVLATVTWVPLMVFSLLEGLAVGGAKIPFLYDIAAHARFLVAVPILVLAEIPIGRRLRGVAKRFLEAGLVREDEQTRFASCVVDTVRFHDWRLAELTLLALAYTTTYMVVSKTSLSGSTWVEPSLTAELSRVGYYYALVSLPIYQFLIYRWAFRMVVWTTFLWQVSKLDLFLTPTHPDGAGGLGFLGKVSISFGVVLFALSSVVSAAIASKILFSGAKLDEFEVTYAALLVLMLALFGGPPIIVFAPTLFRLKQDGLRRYGTLASRYTQQFDSKWAEDINSSEEPLLGTADIQSLADLGNSYDLIRKMRAVPISLSDFIAMALPAALPVLPLLATVMPVSEILTGILKLLG